MKIPQRLFERTLSLDEFLNKNICPPVVVTCRGEGTRASAIKKKIIGSDTYVEIEHKISPTSRSSTSASIYDNINIYLNGTYRPEYRLDTLFEMFVELRQRSPILLIDISTMSVRLIALLLAAVAEVHDYKRDAMFSRVFCGYTEPMDYDDSFEIDDGGKDLFRLYKAYDPLSPIPGYYSIDANKRGQRVWAVLLGFEGNRVHLLQNELTNIQSIEAYITTPTMRLGWVNNVFRSNLHFLEGVDNAKPEIKYVAATSPFAIYNQLSDLKRQSVEQEDVIGLYVSPLGTKANALGALLYLLNDPSSTLVYDNPNEDTRKQEKASDKVRVFDVTAPLEFDRMGE